jgi:ketosteroid isomerase-like protein
MRRSLQRPLIAVLLVGIALVLFGSAATRAGWPRRERSVPAHSDCPFCDAPLSAPVVPPVPVMAPAPVEERDSIRQVLDEQVAAWNKGDLERFMIGYWSSPDLSFFSGKDRTFGWRTTLERYQKKYQSEGQEMGQLRFEELNILLLGPDAALVRGRWQLTRKKDAPGGLFTLIFRKMPEGWRIIHDHTSG